MISTWRSLLGVLLCACTLPLASAGAAGTTAGGGAFAGAAESSACDASFGVRVDGLAGSDGTWGFSVTTWILSVGPDGCAEHNALEISALAFEGPWSARAGGCAAQAAGDGFLCLHPVEHVRVGVGATTAAGEYALRLCVEGACMGGVARGASLLTTAG